MNDQHSTDLIDENEVRAALRPLRPDADAFAAAVQEKLTCSVVSPVEAESDHPESTASDWTRIAASVIPIPMFGKAGVKAAGSLAGVSFGKKLIAMMALPAISLVLMLGGTLWCMLKISRASKSADASQAETKESWEAVTQWWMKYGWILVAIPFLHFALKFLGVTIPLVLIFALSGPAMVWLMTELGRSRWISRQQVVQGLLTGFIVVSGLANVEKFGGSSVHLLDQSSVSAVLSCGMLILVAISGSSLGGLRGGGRTLQVIIFIVALIPIGFLVRPMFRTLWHPVTTKSVQEYVSGFNEAPYSSASWRHWTIPAKWLHEKNLEADTSGAQELALKEIVSGRNKKVLCYALEFGLITGNQAPVVDLYEHQLKNLFEKRGQGKRLLFLTPNEYVIRKLLAEGRLTEEQRVHLSGRLVVTLRAELANERASLPEVWSITELMKLIDRPAEFEEFRAPIHELLQEMQRLNNGPFQTSGGFASYASVKGCDDNATMAAIELMEDWGVPAGIDVMALRSYLRPTYVDRSMRGTGESKLPGIRAGGALHFVGRQRLNDMTDVPAVTWWDYLWYEQKLIMALLLTTLAIYAALAAPNRLPGPNRSPIVEKPAP